MKVSGYSSIPACMAAFFEQNVGKIVTHEEIVQAVWGSRPPADKRATLYRTIRRMHKKSLCKYRIKTVYGVGYRVIALMRLPKPAEKPLKSYAHGRAKVAAPPQGASSYERV